MLQNMNVVGLQVPVNYSLYMPRMNQTEVF